MFLNLVGCLHDISASFTWGFHSNIVDHSVLQAIMAMWEELAGQVVHRDQLISATKPI